jgi:CheY-like chemotaxis protein
MIPFIFLLFSMGVGITLYAMGFAAILTVFVIASPIIFAWLMYKDIQEIQKDGFDLIDVGTGNVVSGTVAVSGTVPVAETAAVAEKGTPAAPTAVKKASRDREIDILQTTQVPELLEGLPYNSSHHADFGVEDGKWAFRFKLNSPRARFSAGGLGDSPTEAFLIAKQVIQKQIREWHEARVKNLAYDAATNEDLLLKITAAAKEALRPPTVMIVDDDIDVAASLELIFRQLGCETTMITNPNDLHRKISMGDSDFIVLDWMLSERIQADQVVEKAARVIDSFSDLKEKFQHTQPKIITHSVLGKGAIHMPNTGYFKHLDHWQKPISHYELTTRTSELLTAAGY